eukprot:TRINITY_DN19077_c0_g1_i4.p1 TRINITY_DN19077_c0_g1~~TRINITY_DN19077_c0_g1_i4.p1  ORF type:complete len:185 (-),score=43.89 TRINITY_DN19077_c0_g1_i4:650-1204(-)
MASSDNKENIQRNVFQEQGPQGAPNNGDELVSIKLNFNDGLVTYKMKRDTPMRKLFNSFYGRNNIEPGTVRFLFDGHRIQDHDTVASLFIEEGDVIEVYGEQSGGNMPVDHLAHTIIPKSVQAPLPSPTINGVQVLIDLIRRTVMLLSSAESIPQGGLVTVVEVEAVVPADDAADVVSSPDSAA